MFQGIVQRLFAETVECFFNGRWQIVRPFPFQARLQPGALLYHFQAALHGRAQVRLGQVQRAELVNEQAHFAQRLPGGGAEALQMRRGDVGAPGVQLLLRGVGEEHLGVEQLGHGIVQVAGQAVAFGGDNGRFRLPPQVVVIHRNANLLAYRQEQPQILDVEAGGGLAEHQQRPPAVRRRSRLNRGGDERAVRGRRVQQGGHTGIGGQIVAEKAIFPGGDLLPERLIGGVGGQIVRVALRGHSQGRGVSQHNRARCAGRRFQDGGQAVGEDGRQRRGAADEGGDSVEDGQVAGAGGHALFQRFHQLEGGQVVEEEEMAGGTAVMPLERRALQM
jgi:hypothetical protein